MSARADVSIGNTKLPSADRIRSKAQAETAGPAASRLRSIRRKALGTGLFQRSSSRLAGSHDKRKSTATITLEPVPTSQSERKPALDQPGPDAGTSECRVVNARWPAS